MFLTRPIRFQRGVLSAREFGPVQRHASFHHLGAQVSAVWKAASCDDTVVGVIRCKFSRYLLSFAQSDQFLLRFLAPRMIQLRRVNASQSNPDLANADRVPVDHEALA